MHLATKEPNKTPHYIQPWPWHFKGSVVSGLELCSNEARMEDLKPADVRKWWKGLGKHLCQRRTESGTVKGRQVCRGILFILGDHRTRSGRNVKRWEILVQQESSRSCWRWNGMPEEWINYLFWSYLSRGRWPLSKDSRITFELCNALQCTSTILPH